jgi:hypothetical protein
VDKADGVTQIKKGFLKLQTLGVLPYNGELYLYINRGNRYENNPKGNIDFNIEYPLCFTYLFWFCMALFPFRYPFHFSNRGTVCCPVVADCAFINVYCIKTDPSIFAEIIFRLPY